MSAPAAARSVRQAPQVRPVRSVPAAAVPRVPQVTTAPREALRPIPALRAVIPQAAARAHRQDIQAAAVLPAAIPAAVLPARPAVIQAAAPPVHRAVIPAAAVPVPREVIPVAAAVPAPAAGADNNLIQSWL